MAEQPLRYFSVAEGATVPRYGTRSFIGAKRTKEGMVFYPDRVVAIPAVEIVRFDKEYRRALQDGSLYERKKAIDAAKSQTSGPARTRPSGASGGKAGDGG